MFHYSGTFSEMKVRRTIYRPFPGPLSLCFVGKKCWMFSWFLWTANTSETSQHTETTMHSKICVTWDKTAGESTMISGLNKWSHQLCESHNGIAQSITAQTLPKPMHKLIAYAHPFPFCPNKLCINSFIESASRDMHAFSCSKDGCTSVLDQY